MTRPGTTATPPAEWLKPLRAPVKPQIRETTTAPTSPWVTETMKRPFGPTNQVVKLDNLTTKRQQRATTNPAHAPVNWQNPTKKLKQTTLTLQRNIPVKLEQEKPSKPPPSPPAMMGLSSSIITRDFTVKPPSTPPKNVP